MSVVRLLVLGTIRHLGTAHGYAVRQQLEDWRVETWTTVRSGSVYHAIGQLQKEGKLRAVGSEAGARGADRVAFSLTRNGETEFFSLLEDALGSFELTHLSAGVAFLSQLPVERSQALLSELRDKLRANRDFLSRLAAEAPKDGAVPNTGDLLDLWINYLDAIANSVERLVQTLSSGPATAAEPRSQKESQKANQSSSRGRQKR
ncbi:PadR family transcriptional regulator [Rhodoligotrophos defluvii]|uniref:PadR family transcriptional regulator n=1 Tax=Rhodoligotrophos defluvii TaxID=2561934 RepID=UPI001485C0B8|nr:PadR family transcriptional regulator [Rhodoligotrophos defluvii]